MQQDNVVKVLVVFLTAVLMFTTFFLGGSYKQSTIVNYCKTDQAYLSEGLMMQCAVIESRLNKGV